MPSSRRVKLLAVAAVTIFLIILYYNSDSSSHSPYLGDLQASDSHLEPESPIPPPDHAQDLTDTAGVTERLREAEDAAKKAAGEKAGPKPDSPSRMQEAMKNRGGGGKTDPSSSSSSDKEKEKTKEKKAPTGPKPAAPTYDALADLAQILKRSPIVIFSKTYCPYSVRAKDLLLRTYKIVPPPFVVELDKYAHGAELQAALARQTGRGTVPNVLVSGKSIGGCDDLLEMERGGVLVERMRGMAGKRVVEMVKVK